MTARPCDDEEGEQAASEAIATVSPEAAAKPRLIKENIMTPNMFSGTRKL